MFGLMLAFLFSLFSRLLRTNSGRDFQCRVMSDPASSGAGVYAPASWIGVSASTTTPLATDTTLPGEVTGTMARAQGIYAHTNGTNTYTLTKTFTSDQQITIAKAAVFNASSAGTMMFVGLLSAPSILNIGDTLQVTLNVTV